MVTKSPADYGDIIRLQRSGNLNPPRTRANISRDAILRYDSRRQLAHGNEHAAVRRRPADIGAVASALDGKRDVRILIEDRHDLGNVLSTGREHSTRRDLFGDGGGPVMALRRDVVGV